jgi:N-acetylglucosaminyldiphosphoundecaprenol N-acetyl-beta-D-mannosaminyltransferase
MEDNCTLKLFGYEIIKGDKASILRRIVATAARGAPVQVLTINPEMVITGQRNDEIRELYRRANIVVADGVGITLAAKIMGRRGINRYPGIDLASDLMREYAKTGTRVYLLGGQPEVAKRAATKLEKEIEGVCVCGTTDGYFEPAREHDVAASIAQAEPDILLVGMGSPRQEKFIDSYRDVLNSRIMMGVGGSLDVFAGVHTRAPRWVQKSGLEWLFRTFKYPKRLSRLVYIPAFLTLLVKSIFRKQHD